MINAHLSHSTNFTPVDVHKTPSGSQDREPFAKDEFYSEMVQSYVELYPEYATEIVQHAVDYVELDTEAAAGKPDVPAGKYSEDNW